MLRRFFTDGLAMFMRVAHRRTSIRGHPFEVQLYDDPKYFPSTSNSKSVSNLKGMNPLASSIVSSTGKVYSPLSRPATSSSLHVWKPATTSNVRLAKKGDDKAVPANPRYSHVAAKTETGLNSLKVKLQVESAAARFKRIENFKRISVDRLMKIIQTDESKENILLLDLRDASDFENYHIQGAINYPAAMMSRSMYQFIPEILKFINMAGRLMVLYDLQERASASVATVWFEKGIENFVVLTGGLEALSAAYPHLVQDGLPPPRGAACGARRGTTSGGPGASRTLRLA